MNRIDPRGRGTRSGVRAWSSISAFTSRSVNSQGPLRLVPSTRSSSVGPISSSRWGVVMPTLLTTSSTGPFLVSSSATPATSSLYRSASMTWQPSVRKDSLSCSASLSTTVTSAPAMISHLAIASPMPRAAPVTTARRPLRSSRSSQTGGTWFA